MVGGLHAAADASIASRRARRNCAASSAICARSSKLSPLALVSSFFCSKRSASLPAVLDSLGF